MSQADDVFDLCEACGLFLDPWQKIWLRRGLAQRADKKWAAFEVAGVVARQNGKGEVLMAREIAGAVLLGEQMQIHSAHQFKTCREAFKKMKALIRSSPLLDDLVYKIWNANGEESVEWKNGARLQYVARENNSGRGFTGDLIVFDEAQILGNGPIEDMMPTLSTKPRAQVWYAGTTGTERSVYLARLRRRAQAGDAGRLAYLEWSVDPDSYDPAVPAFWAQANPALGIRISEEYVADERAALPPEGFARERLSVGDWPTDAEHRVIPADRWLECADRRSPRPADPVVFAVDVNPERTSASIAVAGRRDDGMLVVEMAEPPRQGLEWVAARCEELDGSWRPLLWVVDKGGPAGTEIEMLEQAGLSVMSPTVAEVAQASEGFYDLVMQSNIRHCADVDLDAAVAGATTRPIGEGWGWARRTSSTNISALVAASLAVWGFRSQADRELGPDDFYIG
jgi:phage terminase large subunit-like protein